LFREEATTLVLQVRVWSEERKEKRKTRQELASLEDQEGMAESLETLWGGK